MMYFKIDTDTFIKYDDVNGGLSIIKKSDLVALREKLRNVPGVPDNAVLLAWAKVNYPGIADMGKDKDQITAITAELAIINAL